MTQILTSTVQSVFLILLAPLVMGIVKKTKALLLGRKGAPILQPYYDLSKWFRKESVVSVNTSWLFRFTPYLIFGAMASISMLLPAFFVHPLLSHTGDFVLVVYLFALCHFFMALSGVDTGSSFGAMGASREMFVSVLEEPVLFVTLIAIALRVQTTNLEAITAHTVFDGTVVLSPAFYMIVASFIILIISLTRRTPVDNPETHLELTMIHEGMLLEYSGRHLALMNWSTWLKQIILYTLFVDFCFPWGIAMTSNPVQLLESILIFVAKLVMIALLIAMIERSYAKLQLVRVQRLLFAAFVLSVVAILTEYLL